ncbi:hypothetical protein [Hominenteromicrobium sp.]|uniref:hypothetical protein n=1 Tax=Hominenteromicrobium sp. TaxID=3073581 RepID=UPI0039997419
MIGSDLESEDGSATDDLPEMADAALSENIHLALGSAAPRAWWNDVCTDDESERFVIENGDTTLLQSLGSMNHDGRRHALRFRFSLITAYLRTAAELLLSDQRRQPVTRLQLRRAVRAPL